MCEKYKLEEGMKLYHISDKKYRSDKIFRPRIPKCVYVCGDEDRKTKRICVSTCISGCIKGIFMEDFKHIDLYVYEPYTDKTTGGDICKSLFKPTKKEVFDVVVTREKWITCKCKMKLVKKVRSIGRKNGYVKYRTIKEY